MGPRRCLGECQIVDDGLRLLLALAEHSVQTCCCWLLPAVLSACARWCCRRGCATRTCVLAAGSGPSRGTWWWWTTCECVGCGPLCFTKHSCTEQCESGFGGWQCSPPVSSSPALVKRQCQHQGLALRLKAGPGAYVTLCRGRADGEVFESTKARGKPIVYLYGSRPFTGGICAGRGRGALLVLP